MGPGGGVSALGVAFLTALAVTGWTGVTLLLTPLFLLALVPQPDVACVVRPLYRRVTHFVQWAWMGNVVFLLEYVYGVRVSVTGDAATKAREANLSCERALWMSNHRTRIDWMLLWSLALRTHSLDQMKIVLKAPLRQIPIFGWAMQHFLFIFLNRRWADDEKMLTDYLPFLTSKESGASYLIFPEGTDLADTNLIKSAAFAKEKGLDERKYSLYPRTTGWCFMFPQLRAGLDAVYDITMFYVDYAPNERPSEAALLSGRMPRSVHFHVERFDIREMPLKEKELAGWVETRFTRKEAALKEFYEQDGKLPKDAQPILVDDPAASISLLVAFWIVFVALATQWAWAWGSWSLVFAGVVAVGYLLATFALGGIDGMLRKTL